MGKQGFKDASTLCVQKSHYLASKLAEAGIPQRFSGPFFKEFVITCPAPVVDINKALLEKKMIGGLPLPDAPNDMLVCVTEQRTKEELDSFVDVLAAFVKGEVA
jgi:glycine dehydrogenase subunit 1